LPPIPQLGFKRQSLIKRILNVKDAASKRLIHRQKMAGKRNEFIEILLAKDLGNASLSGLLRQLGRWCACQQNNGGQGDPAYRSQLPGQSEAVAIGKLTGDHHEIKRAVRSHRQRLTLG
jgi:hypothetical protein